MSVLAFNIFYPLIMALLIITPLRILNNIKNKKLYFIFLVTSYLLVAILTYNDSSILGMPLQLLLSFIYSFIYNKNIINSFITSLLSLIIIAISDTLVGFFSIGILHFNYSETKSNLTLYFILGVFILFVTIVISKLIKKIFFKFFTRSFILKLESNYNRIMLFTTVTVFVVSVSFITILRCFVNFVNTNFFFLYSISVIFFLAVFLIIIYFAIRYVKLSIKQDFIDKENKQLKDYSNMLENMSTDLRRFKHDYINILATLGEFINQGDIDNLKAYYTNELLPESTQIITKDKHISLLKNLKMTPLKALISSKIIYAQSKGIETIVEILDEIDKLPIRTLDICRIIGIFLDNAIDATLLCDKKFIHLAIVQNDNNIIIAILNSCLEDTPPVYAIYGKDFSTKGENRGIGLKTVKYMLNENYKNILLNTTIHNCVFKQEMIISKSDD